MSTKLMVIGFGLVLTLGLSGCAVVEKFVPPGVVLPLVSTPTVMGPLTPSTSGIELVDTSIEGAERTLTLAMQAAKYYTDLPRCGAVGAGRICSDREIVRQIRAGAIKAHSAVVAARTNQALVGFAWNAVNAFSNVLPKS